MIQAHFLLSDRLLKMFFFLNPCLPLSDPQTHGGPNTALPSIELTDFCNIE